MKKKCFQLLCFLSALTTTSYAQILDGIINDPGDLIITAYHNNPDGFSFVFLDDCPANTSIRFIDEEWTGSSFASLDSEGEILWTNNTATSINRGTVIHITNASDETKISASLGSATEFMTFNTSSGDEIIAITGTRSAPEVFLCFFGDPNGSTLNGTHLVNGETALQDSSLGMGYYSGPSHCHNLQLTDCAKQLTAIENWTVTAMFTYPDDVYDFIHFSASMKTGFDEIEGFQCSPNPATDKINIQAAISIERIEIYNLLGEKIVEQALNNTQANLTITHFSAGLYYAKAIAGDQITTFSFVKK